DADVASEVDERFLVERLRVDDRRVDIGEDLEFGRAADVVAVARRAVGNDAMPVRLSNLAGLERLDHAVLLGHAPDPAVGLDHRSPSAGSSRTAPAGNLRSGGMRYSHARI